MNPPGTIGGNVPQDTGWGGGEIFNSITGISDFADMSGSWHRAAISKNAGRENIFKIEKYVKIMLKFIFKTLHAIEQRIQTGTIRTNGP